MCWGASAPPVRCCWDPSRDGALREASPSCLPVFKSRTGASLPPVFCSSLFPNPPFYSRKCLMELSRWKCTCPPFLSDGKTLSPNCFWHWHHWQADIWGALGSTSPATQSIDWAGCSGLTGAHQWLGCVAVAAGSCSLQGVCRNCIMRRSFVPLPSCFLTQTLKQRLKYV